MLKGIKKSQKGGVNKVDEGDKADQPEVEQTKVNSHALKRCHIQQEDQSEETYLKTYKDTAQACINLYLSGQTDKLKKLLETLLSLKKDQQIKVENHTQKRFSYDLDLRQTGKRHGRSQPIMATNKFQEHCDYCPDNQELDLISASNYVYLAQPKRKTFKNYHHLILAPVDHEQTSVGLDENVLTEINNFKKCLLQAFDKLGLVVIFFQQFSQENTHIYVECLAIPLTKAQDLPLFFKQALESVEGNWTTHRNIIRIQREKGGIQKQIPKKINYFYIDFSLGYGYAHAIQNQKHWNRGFCYQVLATALGLSQYSIKTTQEYTKEEWTARRQDFLKIWKIFDWTALL